MKKAASPRAYMGLSIPMTTATRIIKIMDTLGYASVAEFCKEAIREHLRHKESEYDRITLEKLDAL